MVRYIPGMTNWLADCLFRLGSQKDTIKIPKLYLYQITSQLSARSDSLNQLRVAMQEDDVLVVLKQVIIQGWPSNVKEVPKAKHRRWVNLKRSKNSDFHKINTILGQHNDWRHLNICGSKTPRSIDYRNILTVQLIDTKIKSMCEFQIHCPLINCRSVVNKSMELQVELVQNRIDICSLAETLIRDDDTAAETQISPPGYKAISVPRSNRQGGGIAIVYRDLITIQRSNTYDYTTMECSDFAVSLPGLSVNMAVIYRPPDKSVCSFVSDFLDYMERNINSTGKLLLTVDFYIHINDPESPDANTFLDVLDSFGLRNHISFPTHHLNNILDLVITPCNNNS